MKLSRSVACVVFSLALSVQAGAQQFLQPTAEELSMTSIPEVPGAPAVILYKEEKTDDAMHTFSIYTRIKVLTEGGKEYANVELPYAVGVGGTVVDAIEGRTIQPDGTIVPLKDKPYQKLIEKSREYKFRAMVFTLPAVQVGSIIEYRYKIFLEDNYFRAPDWIIQSDLYLRKAHYQWKPTSKILESADGKSSQSVAWFPLLPVGAAVKETIPPKAGTAGSPTEGNSLITLDVQNIAPIPKEQYMLPMQSLSYRVMFYYTSYRSSDEYWKSEGKTWSNKMNRFIGPNKAVSSAAEALVQSSDTPEQKLKKIYTAIAAFDNTSFSREETSAEVKANGGRNLTSTADVLELKRGSPNQLAELFVAMARSVGLKAYLMAVADRSQRLFVPGYLSLSQLDDDIAVVSVDGKDEYFDPGQRYCSFGHLAWKHTFTRGLRQTDQGPILASTPGESYKAARVTRIALLTMDDHGVASGNVTLTFTGDPALRWRQRSAEGDETSLKSELRQELETMLPGSMEVKVQSIENVTDPEQPLKVVYEVKGPVGTATGKRLLVPAYLFESNEKPTFPQPTRELAVDLHYGMTYQDAVRYKLPATLEIESIPAAASEQLPQNAGYSSNSKRDGNSITIFRNLSIGGIFYLPKDYPGLRGFYTKFQTADQESLVLTRANTTTDQKTNAAGSSN